MDRSTSSGSTLPDAATRIFVLTCLGYCRITNDYCSCACYPYYSYYSCMYVLSFVLDLHSQNANMFYDMGSYPNMDCYWTMLGNLYLTILLFSTSYTLNYHLLLFLFGCTFFLCLLGFDYFYARWWDPTTRTDPLNWLYLTKGLLRLASNSGGVWQCVGCLYI